MNKSEKIGLLFWGHDGEGNSPFGQYIVIDSDTDVEDYLKDFFDNYYYSNEEYEPYECNIHYIVSNTNKFHGLIEDREELEGYNSFNNICNKLNSDINITNPLVYGQEW